MYDAKIILDSYNESYGSRLTTMQLTHPRIVHSEFMTHGSFARNASSSRAIPFNKMAATVVEDPFVPVWWGKNQAGMQAHEELSPEAIVECQRIWLEARDLMLEQARKLHELGLHKQICNRLLEPWGWITVCVTGDEPAWANYFALRCHGDAQPEIRKQAYMAQLDYFRSTPQKLKAGWWHLPYLRPQDVTAIMPAAMLRAISVGRVARTSYLTQEGTSDISKDIELHDRLLNATPMHASPFEHVCLALEDSVPRGKFRGWQQYRHMIVNESTSKFIPNHPELT